MRRDFTIGLLLASAAQSVRVPVERDRISMLKSASRAATRWG
jgi:hypothetical protein